MNTMLMLKITSRGTVTIPRYLRRKFVLKSNDLLIAEETKSGILLKPAFISPTEFYTEKQIAEFEKNNNESIADFFPDKRRTTKKV